MCGRYIWIRREAHSHSCKEVACETSNPSYHNHHNILNLDEVVVTKPGGEEYTVAADGITAAASSVYELDNSFAIGHLIDGCIGRVGCRSATGIRDNEHPWLRVDLGGIKPIASVLVVNRQEVCFCRITGARLIITTTDAVPLEPYDSNVRAAIDMPSDKAYRFYKLNIDGGTLEMKATTYVTDCVSSDC